jgi:anaerobic ribonucleoside-triphosphate reductase activating protein
MVFDQADLVLRVSRILAPVDVLGPGGRVAIWVQGCAIACPSCASVDTWDPHAGTSMPVMRAADMVIEQLEDHDLDGIAITGGEPTDQGPALTELLRLVRLHRAPDQVDAVVFTGRSLAAARSVAPGLMAAADCVVSGPYQARRPAANRLIASDNQVLTFANRDIELRYRHWLAHEGPRLQVTADESDLYLVGLPRPGDLDEFAARLSERGVHLGAVSWRA